MQDLFKNKSINRYFNKLHKHPRRLFEMSQFHIFHSSQKPEDGFGWSGLWLVLRRHCHASRGFSLPPPPGELVLPNVNSTVLAHRHNRCEICFTLEEAPGTEISSIILQSFIRRPLSFLAVPDGGGARGRCVRYASVCVQVHVQVFYLHASARVPSTCI